MEWLENICDTWVIFLVRLWSVLGKNIRKKCWFDHSSPYKAASIQKKTAKKSLQCLWPPLNCLPLLQSLHQINLTIFFHFIFHFLSLDSIDYIMIILELISPEQRTIEQKYLLTTQKKITIIKKKKTEILSPPSCPPAINYRSSRKSQFLVNWPDKNMKKYKNLTPHIFID